MLVARYGAVAPIPNLDRLVAERLDAAMNDQNEMESTTVNVTPEKPGPGSARLGAWAGHTPMTLSYSDDDGGAVVGVAVMLSGRRQSHRVPHRLLNALARALVETGDVPLITDGIWRSRLTTTDD
jgi:hypothetical protein